MGTPTRGTMVRFRITIQNIDYRRMEQNVNEDVKYALIANIKSITVDQLSSVYTTNNIDVALYEGSATGVVIADVDVTPIQGADQDALLRQVDQARPTLQTELLFKIKNIQDISRVLVQGMTINSISLTIDEPTFDTPVEPMSSSRRTQLFGLLWVYLFDRWISRL